MKKNTWIKIAGLTFTISLVVGMIGGALTNEYLVSYLFGQLTQKQKEELPIVKKVIEERTYIEESSITDAIKQVAPAVTVLYATKQIAKKATDNNLGGINGVVLTTDGIIASCDSRLNEQNIWYAIIKDKGVVQAKVVLKNGANGLVSLQIQNDDVFYKTISLAKNDLKLGQKTIALNNVAIMSALLSSIDKNIYTIDRRLGADFNCSPIVNLGGELIGLVSVRKEESYVTPVIPARNLEGLLAKEEVL